MKAKLNYKDNPSWAIKSITMDLSVLESLLFKRALTALVKDNSTHPDDVALARKVLADWQDFIDSLRQK